MTKWLGLAVLVLAHSAQVARADILNWSSGWQLDNGVRPAVALGTIPSVGAWEVEVHQGQAGVAPLWYSAGRASGVVGLPQVGNSSQFDYGFAPALATINQNPPTVLEVHQSKTGMGEMYFSVGTMTDIWGAPNTIAWTSPSGYDTGIAPAIAVYDNHVIEVHQGQTGFGPLWYHVGNINGSNVTWNVGATNYDNGVAPSVAIAKAFYGLVIVEVHQGGTGFGPLWYRTGALQSDGSVVWNQAFQYDYGVAPSVTVQGDRVIEVHEGQDGFGPLWYHTGVLSNLSPSQTNIAWDANAYLYDQGYRPAVAWNTGVNEGIELHQGTSTFGPLWEHPFSTRPVVPLYAQAEGDWCWITAPEMIISSIVGVQNDPGMNSASYATLVECDEADLRQGIEGGWGPSKTFVECCDNVSWNSTSPCNRGGQFANTLHDNGFTCDQNGGPASFATLDDQIASGLAVGFDITWNDGSGGHSMVVTETIIDESGTEWVLVNDPKNAEEAYTYAVWSNTNRAQYDFTLATTYTNIRRQ